VAVVVVGAAVVVAKTPVWAFWPLLMPRRVKGVIAAVAAVVAAVAAAAAAGGVGGAVKLATVDCNS